MEKTVNFDLTGKVAIVTGGSRGLGVELATSMAEYGADIALMAGNVEKMKKVAADITEKTGRKVIWVKVNIGDEESVKAAVQTVMDEYGKIDILVNNAGIIRYGRPEEMTYKDWTFRLAGQLPQDAVLVSESGISDPEIVNRLRAAGFRGFLIGETFMKTQQPGETLQNFLQAIQ